MKVNPLFKEYESFTIYDYLKKFGIDDPKTFCNPTSKCMESPNNYDNMDDGFKLFDKHMDLNSTTGIIIDVDLDGYTSASIIFRYIRELDFNGELIPLFHNRRIHGMNDTDILKTIKENNIKFLIVPDAGSNDFTIHKKLSDIGVEILILDHHDCNKYSEDAIVINNQISENVINKNASGALVTWKFCKYCDMQYNKNIASKLMELAYFSLISDIMDMRSLENRFIASWYLDKSHIKHNLFYKLIDTYIKSDVITNNDIAFMITPKLSSIIRSDDEELKKALFISLVYGDYPDDKISEFIEKVVKESRKLYDNQKKIVNDYYDAHLVDIVNRNIICEETDINSEFRGLVASKYVNYFNKPTLLYSINKDHVSVSLRANYDVKDFINSSGLINLMGHGSAAGGAISEENLPKLIEWCTSAEVPEPCYDVAQSLNATSISPNTFTITKGYDKIFGKKIEVPVFHINNIRIKTKDIKELGNGSTVKFTYCGVDYIKFFCSKKEREEVFHIGSNCELLIEIIGELSENNWKGNITPQVKINKIEVKKATKKTMVVSDIF